MSALGTRSARSSVLLPALFLGVALLLQMLSGVAVSADVGETEAQAILVEADSVLREAFAVVLSAEDAGANVSALAVRLTEAGSALTRAEVALAGGNLSGAASLAGVCSDMAQSVADDASVLRSEALRAAVDWRILVGVSVFAGVAFVMVLFVVWRLFRRWFLRRLMGYKPEVAE